MTPIAPAIMILLINISMSKATPLIVEFNSMEACEAAVKVVEAHKDFAYCVLK